MTDMGVDICLKNEFVNGEALKLAHKGFLRNDPAALKRLKALGISDANELKRRRED